VTRLAAILAMLCGPVVAQSICAPREEALRVLVETYGEARQSGGLAMNGGLVETWGNPASGTWTITATRPDGQTCIIVAGVAFQTFNDDKGV
jgi:hypothetical protein